MARFDFHILYIVSSAPRVGVAHQAALSVVVEQRDGRVHGIHARPRVPAVLWHVRVVA